MNPINENRVNNYVVNSAVYNNVNKPKAVDDEIQNILEKTASIAGNGRKVVVVIGINAPDDNGVSDSQMKDTVKRAQSIASSFQKENFEVKVIDYRWNRFDNRLKHQDYKANERINYVAIRNNLFYSEENQSAVGKAIEDASHHDLASVKFLALDGDSELSLEKVEKLEKYWGEHTKVEHSSNQQDSYSLPPLITSGFYKFEIDPEKGVFVDSNGQINWGMYLAIVENSVDLESKKLLATEQFNSELIYRKLSLPINSNDISNEYILARIPKFQKNVFVLDKVHTVYNQEQINALKIHYCDILSIVEAYKDALKKSSILDESSFEDKFALQVIRERLISELRSIAFIENELPDIEKTTYSFSINGKQVLYPSENVMFISLYDKIQNKEFNVYKAMLGPEVGKGNVNKLWGNDVGREEGENIASQMRKFWQMTRVNDPDFYEKKPENFSKLSIDKQREWSLKKSQHKVEQVFKRERDVVSYDQIFTTALPPRAHMFLTDEQKAIGKKLPENMEALKEAARDPAKLDQIVDSCAELIATRSQTSLSKKFLNQRMRYIQAIANKDLIDPQKKLSVFTRSVRNAISESFETYFQEFQQNRIDELKNQIRKGIQELAG